MLWRAHDPSSDATMPVLVFVVRDITRSEQDTEITIEMKENDRKTDTATMTYSELPEEIDGVRMSYEYYRHPKGSQHLDMREVAKKPMQHQ